MLSWTPLTDSSAPPLDKRFFERENVLAAIDECSSADDFNNLRTRLERAQGFLQMWIIDPDASFDEIGKMLKVASEQTLSFVFKLHTFTRKDNEVEEKRSDQVIQMVVNELKRYD